MEHLSFKGANYGFLQFSNKQIVKLKSAINADNYYLAIFLGFEDRTEVRVIKLKKGQCIDARIRDLKAEPDAKRRYHAIWTKVHWVKHSSNRFIFDYNNRFLLWF